jgi:L-threonylcarbamoyladenylate synthase
MDPGVLGELARRGSVPIAATTANISEITGATPAGPAITTAEVERFVADVDIEVAYCVEGGICPLANHLTIVDCTTAETRIVRSGVIHDRAVAAAITAVQPQPA